MRLRSANSIVRQAIGCHFFLNCFKFTTKELQRGVTRFSVAEVVGAPLDRLCVAINTKRSGLLSSGVVLLHDNAQPHTATRIMNKLTKFGWTVLENQPYSPDLSPCDFHIFGTLKQALKCRLFTWTAKSWSLFESGFDLHQTSSTSKVFTTW
ncbi:hypothetical protein AVEN_859-1 [Araneus ventricosus]|uniref:Mariner Mos1 transposase n=1 Tax=Araneus ventricosus TaxID=182803 RepID=A0A4Y2NWW2_ARAVE|nr:hypothetical protein AVEN_859-1 [Araneus ventricosus]